MWLAYIDESYSPSEYWFAVILVDADKDAALQRAVIAIPSRYGTDGPSLDAEVHGYPLWNGSQEWKGVCIHVSVKTQCGARFERSAGHPPRSPS